MQRALSMLLFSLAFATPVVAQQKADDHAFHHPVPPLAMAPAGMTDGEIRKVDREAGKLTIRHDEIRNLGMPPMTMVFKLGDTAMLGKLKAGDKVSFKANNEGGTLMATDIQVSR